MIDFSKMTDFTSTIKFKNNIVFLDVDGVLNGYNRWNTLGWNIVCFFKNYKLRRWYQNWADPFGVHKNKVKLLAKIVRKTGAKIVMSSTWRLWWNRPYEKQDEDMKKLIDLFNKYNIDVIGVTPVLSNQGRDSEIIQWLAKHEDEVENFVILDDENSFMQTFWEDERFIQTSEVPKGIIIKGLDSEDTGLKRKHVKQAIKVLNGEK